MLRSVALVVFVLGPVGLAHAQGDGPDEAAPTDEARLADAQHSFEVATAAYDAGDYETAAAEFRYAYELTQHPELLFNVYLAEERAGRPAEAADALTRYLAEASVPDAERPTLERRLEHLRARAAAREPVAPDELDEHALLSSPIEEAAPAAPPPTPTPAPDAPETGGSPNGAGIGFLVAGGTLLVAFAVLAPLSEVEDQRLASTCGRDAGRSCSDTSTLLALDVAADVSWIGGAALGVLGLVLVLALPPDRPASVALLPRVGPDGVGLTAAGTF